MSGTGQQSWSRAQVGSAAQPAQFGSAAGPVAAAPPWTVDDHTVDGRPVMARAPVAAAGDATEPGPGGPPWPAGEAGAEPSDPAEPGAAGRDLEARTRPGAWPDAVPPGGEPGASPADAGPEASPAEAEPSGREGALLSGRYRLEQRIAAGGMGEVWRASDEVLGRPVAVKLLRHAYAGDEALASRFRAEARYAASLSHPGIAQVFDYGEQATGPAGGAYLVMELVPGEPLSAILARTGALPAKATLDIVAQAANALQAAHASGIVHRDIKPGNVLVTADGRVKITDFGIARAAQAAQSGHLTQTGMVMGTAQYVSPEQASGLRVTHASDIYSLGVVAYECLAGRPPFEADALIAVALAHVRETPPPLPPGVPALVADMVMRMLAKQPEDRPVDARAVAERATLLRDTISTATPGPGLADVAAEDAGGWFTPGTVLPAEPTAHDGTTTQLPVGSPQKPGRLHGRRRAVVAGALIAAFLAAGGVTTALLAAGHHGATPAGSKGKPSPTVHATHSQPPATPPSSSPPAVVPVVPPSTAAPGVTQPASPTATPTPTATATPTPTATPTATPTPHSPTPTPSASSTLPTLPTQSRQ